MAKTTNLDDILNSLTPPSFLGKPMADYAPIWRAQKRWVTLDETFTSTLALVAGVTPETYPLSNESGLKVEKKKIAEAGHKTLTSEHYASDKEVKEITDAARKKFSPKQVNEVLVENRQAQIREILWRKCGDDSLKLSLEVKAAISRRDTETLDALLGAPGPHELNEIIDKESITVSRIELGDAELGEDVFDYIQAAKELNEQYEIAKAELAAIAFPEEDKIADLAAGKSDDEEPEKKNGKGQRTVDLDKGTIEDSPNA